MRTIALVATYNEERFIAACLENLFRQGVEVYLIDNSSTDQTVSIARQYLDRGLLGIETLPRNGLFKLRDTLERKTQLAVALQADWFMHVDADEIRLPPDSNSTIAEALAQVDSQGYNAVNFLEFTFVPVKESPDHDHPDFQRTMRWYYPFQPFIPYRMNTWKRLDGPVDLAWSAGHRVRFPGLRMYPRSFPMRHYLFLSVPHAIRKFVERRYDPGEVKSGWHGVRARLRPDAFSLPRPQELREYIDDDHLDPLQPRKWHCFDDRWVVVSDDSQPATGSMY